MPENATYLDWVTKIVAGTAGILGLSLVVLVVSLWAVRWYLIAIPADYFTREHQPLERWQHSHPALRWTLLVGKNALGALLIFLGLVMVFTPGQGILTLLLGISLLDFPGKKALEKRIMQRPAVAHLINAMRARAGKPPLQFE